MDWVNNVFFICLMLIIIFDEFIIRALRNNNSALDKCYNTQKNLNEQLKRVMAVNNDVIVALENVITAQKNVITAQKNEIDALDNVVLRQDQHITAQKDLLDFYKMEQSADYDHVKTCKILMNS